MYRNPINMYPHTELQNMTQVGRCSEATAGLGSVNNWNLNDRQPAWQPQQSSSYSTVEAAHLTLSWSDKSFSISQSDVSTWTEVMCRPGIITSPSIRASPAAIYTTLTGVTVWTTSFSWLAQILKSFRLGIYEKFILKIFLRLEIGRISSRLKDDSQIYFQPSQVSNFIIQYNILKNKPSCDGLIS